jgi:hypothetical protein
MLSVVMNDLFSNQKGLPLKARGSLGGFLYLTTEKEHPRRWVIKKLPMK